MKALLERLSDATNIGVTRKHRLIELKAREHAYFDLAFLGAMPQQDRNRCHDLLEASNSQLRQDLFALAANGFKEGGYFVEFGATNGVELNNSYLMERDFGWSGLLAEPARMWHNDLQRNRTCQIDTDCVWKESGARLSFTETPRGENSGISDLVKRSRQLRGTSYEVDTISLTDLLARHNAPEVIDYMSVDTEGSEFDILKAFDFSKYRFRTLTIEHNFAPQRDDIYALLTSHGYRRILENISRFDDWYIGADERWGHE